MFVQTQDHEEDEAGDGADDHGADDHGDDDHSDIYHGETTPPELEVEAPACLPRLKPGLKSINSIANAGLQDRF